MNILISLTVVIISQCTHKSKYYVVHLKYINFSFVKKLRSLKEKKKEWLKKKEGRS